jgi:hypothetical protein
MGLGLGGFVDGIVLHQILQWHHMLSDTGDNPMTTVAGLEANTLADGFFHLATWLLVAVAMTLTVTAWREGKLAPPWTAHFGMLLAGWGVFNVVEGAIDHEAPRRNAEDPADARRASPAHGADDQACAARDDPGPRQWSPLELFGRAVSRIAG